MLRINDMPKIMVKCLVCTIIIELVIALICGVRKKKDIVNVILVNVLTNPVVVSLPIFLLTVWGLKARIISLIILEILAFLLEGFIYSKVLDFKKINPYVLSLILNLGSYFIGEVINRL